MAVAMLIGLWIHDELSFNKSFQNYDRIGQVMVRRLDMGQVDINRSLPIPLGVELRSNYGSDFKYVVMSTPAEDYIISDGNNKFTEKGSYMQPEAPDLFSLKMLNGSRSGLKDPHSILLSGSMAKTIFGAADPMNKLLRIDDKLVVKVTGVYKDLPHNTQINDLAFIVPWDLLISSSSWYQRRQTDWTDNFLVAYVQLSANASFDKVSAKIKNIKAGHETKEQAADQPAVFLHPMSQWHLYSKWENGVRVTSQPLEFVWLYGIIGIFVLLLACINFMNLSTARSEKRAKEVGIRKTMGSLRSQLISQFFSESLLVASFAFVLALVLVQVILPWFNQVADKKIQLLWTNPLFWFFGGCFTIFTGLIAGSYPALYLSSFNPAKVLKGSFRIGRLAENFVGAASPRSFLVRNLRFTRLSRKALVVVQFTISITLIIGTIVVYRQIQFSKNRPVGYNRDGLVYINMKTDDIHIHHNAFHDDLLATGAALEMAESNGTINELWSNNGGFKWKGKDPRAPDKLYFGTIGVSNEFGRTAGWQFMAGRDFSRAFAGDSSAFVINEAAVKYMSLKDPVGESIQWGDKYFTIIGVIKDVLMESPYQPVTPTVFFLGAWNHGTVSIRLNPKISAGEALAKIEPVFKKYAPALPFDYKFADSEYAKKFAAENRVGKLARFFSALAILISCLGLFGLASFLAEQRTKEIGVRKVLGATIFNVWSLLSKDFVILVMISFITAVPIAGYFMNNWLQHYPYHTEMSWWIFGATGIGALIITMLTVSFQSIKAALMNPVKSLRSE